jgi:hypothetical protein
VSTKVRRCIAVVVRRAVQRQQLRKQSRELGLQRLKMDALRDQARHVRTGGHKYLRLCVPYGADNNRAWLHGQFLIADE